MIIPASLIDNKPVTVKVQLPAAWIARAFADWIEAHAEDFTEHMLANEGVRIQQTVGGEGPDGITVIFVRQPS